MEISFSGNGNGSVGGLTMLFGAAIIYFGFYRLRTAHKAADLPTSTVRAAAIGEVELKGTAQTSAPLTSPLTKTPCAYYRYAELELREVRDRDSTRLQWVPVGGDEARSDLRLQDDTGSVPIDLDQVTPDLKPGRIFAEKAKRTFLGLVRTGEHEPAAEVHEPLMRTRGYRAGDRKRVEYLITPGMPLYVLGDLQDRGGLVVTRGEGEFVLTDKTEEEFKRKASREAYALIGVGLLIALAGAYFGFIHTP